MRIKNISVSELNSYIRRQMDNDPLLGNVRVVGEVSNFKRHSSGHVYLSLKDDDSKIRAVIFSRYFDKSLGIKEGSKIIATGEVSVFERDGSYQLYIKKVELEGEGELYRRYNELKIKLDKLGIFSSAHKKPIPKFPKAIGVVTSDTGAVIRDIINVITRRYPKIKIILYPSLVQGPGCAEGIMSGIEYFNANNNVDTIIIGRGGGSFEELNGFNDERLAYKIYDSIIPVISAVGHETDFTIADFVADMRAPTPSAAAELATPSLVEILMDLKNIDKRLSRFINSVTDVNKERLRTIFEKIISRIENYVLRDSSLELDRTFDQMEMYMKELIRENSLNLNEKLDRLDYLMENNIKERIHELEKLGSKLGALNPLSTLDRGFGIVEKDGRLVKSVLDVDIDDELTVDMKDGRLNMKVLDVKERSIDGGKLRKN